MFDACDFASPIDFVDVTVIPPGSTIGRHTHSGNEEIYFIISGEPRVVVADQERRLAACGVAVVRSAEAHQLINDTDHDVIIGVVQVRISP